ncbi:hypothetical protein V9L05_01295 [Bernardetia sp. Wsw4-3y2]|uniref:hypothetical protein n=1 Tax=Bernardetia sp. Wsw4-3y2 TaxID=3127471 RepID=UPI0030CC1121
MQDKFKEKETANQTQTGSVHAKANEAINSEMKESLSIQIAEKEEPLHIRKQREMLIEDKNKLLETISDYFGQDGLAVPLKSLNIVFSDWISYLPENEFEQSDIAHKTIDFTRITTFLSQLYDLDLRMKRRIDMIEGK